MITGAELRGRIKIARAAFQQVTESLVLSLEANKSHFGRSWLNLTNAKARERSTARVLAMPGVVDVVSGRFGATFFIVITSFRMIRGRVAAVSEMITQRKGEGYEPMPIIGTLASSHAHERIIQRFGDDDATTLVDIHLSVRDLLLLKGSMRAWEGDGCLLAVATAARALALIDIKRGMAEIITVVDAGLLSPDQEALVDLYAAHKATLEDALAGGAAFGYRGSRSNGDRTVTQQRFNSIGWTK